MDLISRKTWTLVDVWADMLFIIIPDANLISLLVLVYLLYVNMYGCIMGYSAWLCDRS